VNVNGLKSVPRYLPDMVCMTLNESAATPHASGKTKSQPKTNNRKDSLPIWVKLTTTSEYSAWPADRPERRQPLKSSGWENAVVLCSVVRGPHTGSRPTCFRAYRKYPSTILSLGDACLRRSSPPSVIRPPPTLNSLSPLILTRWSNPASVTSVSSK
jgi:hypothetical protein